MAFKPFRTLTAPQMVAAQLQLLLSDNPETSLLFLNRELVRLGVPFELTPIAATQTTQPTPVVGSDVPGPTLPSQSDSFEATNGGVQEPAPPTPVEWTASQSEARSKISTWLDLIANRDWATLENRRFFVLRGYAGTGKSFLTKDLHSSTRSRISMEFCAPTHRATTVLSGYLGFQARTLASRLGVRAVYDEDDITFALPDKPPYIATGTVLVIDESSMISREYLRFLVEIAESLNIFILFIGDPAQLPPVGERSSPVWKLVKDEQQKHTLVDIRRVKDDAIVDLHVALREQIFSKKREYLNPIPEIANGTTVVHTSSQKKFVRYMKDNAELFRDGNAKVIAWRNRTVDHYTEVIRSALGYGADIGIGERLTLSGAFIPFGKGVGVEEVGQNTEEVVVDHVYTSILTPHCELLPNLEVEIPVSVLDLHGESFEAASVAVARTEEAQQKLNKVLSMVATQAREATKDRRRSQALWEFFWDTKRRFIRPRSAYTATSHSFQGSQCQHVYCDTQDILVNPTKSEAFRCLYVAASRCTERIISN